MNQFTNNKKIYDLEERTAVFGENIIGLTRAIKKDEISRPLISQLITLDYETQFSVIPASRPPEAFGRVSWNPDFPALVWIPVFTGMTNRVFRNSK